jgi:hypothetical protein
MLARCPIGKSAIACAFGVAPLKGSQAWSSVWRVRPPPRSSLSWSSSVGELRCAFRQAISDRMMAEVRRETTNPARRIQRRASCRREQSRHDKGPIRQFGISPGVSGEGRTRCLPDRRGQSRPGVVDRCRPHAPRVRPIGRALLVGRTRRGSRRRALGSSETSPLASARTAGWAVGDSDRRRRRNRPSGRLRVGPSAGRLPRTKPVTRDRAHRLRVSSTGLSLAHRLLAETCSRHDIPALGNVVRDLRLRHARCLLSRIAPDD